MKNQTVTAVIADGKMILVSDEKPNSKELVHNKNAEFMGIHEFTVYCNNLVGTTCKKVLKGILPASANLVGGQAVEIEMEDIPCTCPKGGGYEQENGKIETCNKCGGSEWINQPKLNDKKEFIIVSKDDDYSQKLAKEISEMSDDDFEKSVKKPLGQINRSVSKEDSLEDKIYQAIGLAANRDGIINGALATKNVMEILAKNDVVNYQPPMKY